MIKYKVFETKDDWKEFRSGMFTASEAHRLMGDTKQTTLYYFQGHEITSRKYTSIIDKAIKSNDFSLLVHLSTEKTTKDESELSVGAKSYVIERLSEKLSPIPPSFYNAAMERGNEVEPQAVMAYANKMGKSVNDDDFIYTSVGGFVYFWDEDLFLGGTPDVIIRDKRIVEIKCPNSDTHLSYLLLKTAEDLQEAEPKYYAQMQVNMYLTNLTAGDFVSFDDRYYNPDLQMHTIDVPYDIEFIERLKVKLTHANAFRESILNQLAP